MANKISRRKFLKKTSQSAVAGGALLGAATTAKSAKRVPGANNRVRMGWIGCGVRGRRLVPVFNGLPDAEVVAVCDVYDGRAQHVKKITGGKADVYNNYRRMLERKDIDAVGVATPEHWKALCFIHACQAGKDVYAEKPLALTIGEGQFMVKAAKKYDRVVMFGTQQRSMQCYIDAVEYIHSGQLGKISEVRSWNLENFAPDGYGFPEDCDPPAELNWDLWLGPARKVPYNPNRYWKFHWFWDYGNGWVVDWAVHQQDIIHWAMKADKPTAVAASGGKLARKDNTVIPDTLEVVYEYPGFISLYSFRQGNGRIYEDMWYGNAFFGDKGTLVVNRDRWEVFPEPVRPHDIRGKHGFRSKPVKRPGSPRIPRHQQKFIAAVKARKNPEMCNVLDGHRSTIPGHLANISFRTGRKIHWDGDKEVIKNVPEADKYLMPKYRKPWKLET